MSRVGKRLISIPAGVTVKMDDGNVQVKGPKGELELKLPEGITAEIKDQEITVKRAGESLREKSLHGLGRTLIANMVKGVTEGFSKDLEIRGTGYRAEPRGESLVLQLGRSHPVLLPIPPGIEVAAERKGTIENQAVTAITVRGIDRQRVGQFAARIRAMYPPDPYKGKGIRYTDEYVRRKAGKRAV